MKKKKVEKEKDEPEKEKEPKKKVKSAPKKKKGMSLVASTDSNFECASGMQCCKYFPSL